MVAPKYEDGRECLDLFHALEKAATLASPVDDVPHGSRERSCGTSLRVESAELPNLLSGHSLVRAAQRKVRSEGHERLAEILDDARKRRQAKPQPDALPQPSCGHEDESSDPFRALEKKHLRDAASERMTDDIRSIHADQFEPSSDDLRVPIELVAGIRTIGLTVSRKIRHQHSPIRRQQRRHV